MAKNKTTQNESSVADYVAAIADEKRQKDIAALIDLFTVATGLEAKMWGPGIVGFGSYHYKYASGHEGDAPLAGLASRANAITLYLDYEFNTRDELINQLGKYKTSKACIYIQKLADIDEKILTQMIRKSIENTRKRYPD